MNDDTNISGTDDMHRIGLYAVKQALQLATAMIKNTEILQHALKLAGNDEPMRKAVLNVHSASAHHAIAGLSFQRQAISYK